MYIIKILDYKMKTINLHSQKYDRKTLKDYIYAVDFTELLSTQHIDISFAVRYILNKKYQLSLKDKTITPEVVVQYQSHLSLKELNNALLNYDSDDDSIDDFETVCNRENICSLKK